MSKTYTIEIFKSHHHIKTFERTYPNSLKALYYLNCWTNNKFKTMQEVYEYQRNKILRCNNGEDLYLIMRKNGVIIEPKDYV